MCDVSVKIEATYTGSIVVSSALQIDIVELSAAAVGLKVKITQDIVILSYQHRRLLVHYNTKHVLYIRKARALNMTFSAQFSSV